MQNEKTESSPLEATEQQTWTPDWDTTRSPFEQPLISADPRLLKMMMEEDGAHFARLQAEWLEAQGAEPKPT